MDFVGKAKDLSYFLEKIPNEWMENILNIVKPINKFVENRRPINGSTKSNINWMDWNLLGSDIKIILRMRF